MLTHLPSKVINGMINLFTSNIISLQWKNVYKQPAWSKGAYNLKNNLMNVPFLSTKETKYINCQKTKLERWVDFEVGQTGFEVFPWFATATFLRHFHIDYYYNTTLTSPWDWGWAGWKSEMSCTSLDISCKNGHLTQ